MSFLDTAARYIPQVISPTQKKLPLGTKAKWTLIILLAFFAMKHIPLYGLGQASLEQFASLAVILGADFGSMISLGIGPIVTASIVLQLLNGSGLIKFDTSTAKGRSHYQAINKLLAIAFVIVESAVYVFMGGLAPLASLPAGQYFTMELVLIFQLILGGLMIMLLDDLCQKWGLGSGISLFIAAGVSESLFIRTFSWIIPTGAEYPAGALPVILQAFGAADTGLILAEIGAIIATIAVFMLAIYFQAMKVEIPLSFGRVRGHGMRWPLNFLYTSNIPVILIAALLANFQLISSLVANSSLGWTWATTAVQWVTAPDLIGTILRAGSFAIGSTIYLQALTYTVILMAGSVMFSWFWMQTSGMDAKSQAKKIMASGLQIPGFRKDPRVMEHVLNRYVAPLTVMGGLAIGFLAAIADVSGALTSGTGLLLAIMIIYRMYEDVAKQHMEDMNPMMKKMMGK